MATIGSKGQEVLKGLRVSYINERPLIYRIDYKLVKRKICEKFVMPEGSILERRRGLRPKLEKCMRYRKKTETMSMNKSPGLYFSLFSLEFKKILFQD
jgi:hypothetical protein